MTKKFFEVFENIEPDKDGQMYFEDCVVDRISRNPRADIYRVRISGGHIIPKPLVCAMEKKLAQEVFGGSGITVYIIESFDLPDTYTAQMLWEEYSDSCFYELGNVSAVLENMLKIAEISFTSPSLMKIVLEDNFIFREKEDDLILYLDNVFKKRCGLRIDYDIGFETPPVSVGKEDDSLRLKLRVEEITKAAYGIKGGEYLGDNKASPGDKEGEIEENTASVSTSDVSESNKPAKKSEGGATGSGSGRQGSYGKKDASGKDGDKGKYSYRRSADPSVIYGRDILDEAVKISEIEEGIGEVCIRGRVFDITSRDIKNERTIISFALTDDTDSIKAKIFAPTENAPTILKQLEKGLSGDDKVVFAKVKGVVVYDKFDHELSISSVVGIQLIGDFRVPRRDLAETKRVELHCHTKMSEMDGCIEPKDLVNTAFKWGHRAVGITDHAVVHAFTDANHAWEPLWDKEKAKRKEAGDPNPDRQNFFKVLHGVEAYLVDDLHRVVTDECGQTIDDDFVVYDIETTGLSPVYDDIIEFGAVKVSKGEIVDRFSTFVNPHRPIPFKITKLTSITDNDVASYPGIEEILPRFLDFCEGCVLVAHNADFDVNVDKEKCRKLGYPDKYTYMDTLPLARMQLPGHSKYTLDAMAKALGVSLGHHHRAVDDAECTARCFVKFLEQLREEDITTLGQINKKSEESKGAIAKLRANHCTIFAKNELGRIHLYELISRSHLEYFNRFPKIPKSLLLKLRDGLIVGSGCEKGELFEAILEGHTDEQIARVVDFYDYLEIQPISNNLHMLIKDNEIDPDKQKKYDDYENIRSEEDIKNINRRIAQLGKQFHKPVVATGDAHFLNPEDAIYRSIIQFNKKEKSDKETALYFRTTDEMLDEFDYLGPDKAYEVVVKNTNMIADMCETISPVRPDKCPPVIADSDKTLREICYKKAHETYGEELPPIVTERLERELNSIIGNGFAVMYIIAQKLVWKSVEDGYLVGSRGSVGSSFVATMAGITEVNPLSPHYYCTSCHYYDFDSDDVKAYAGKAGVDMPDKLCPNCGKPLKKDGFDIPFETFLGFKGDKEPDIDLNFSSEYQSRAHKYTEVIFGTGQTFRAGTLGTIADKTAYMYTKDYFEDKGIAKRGCEMERIAVGVTGTKRSTGQHPGGIVVLPLGENIYSFTPIQHPANKDIDIITTHFDYHSIDHNLLKLDILGHDDPTMIRMLQDTTDVDPLTIPLDDPGVMSLFENTEALGITPEDIGGTKLGALGIPEFGTDFAMQMLIDTKPKAFSDLVRIAGLAHGTNVWLGNAQTLIKEGKATISTAICTRDDIMTYLISKGVESEESFKIMEAVRKGKVAKEVKSGKPDKWPKWKEDMIANGVPDWYIWSCERIEYMFPKAHAAAYVMMAWRVAYYKINRKAAYYAAFFSIRAKNFSYELMCMGADAVKHNVNALRDKEAQSKEKGSGVSFSDVEGHQLYDLRLVEEMYARGVEFVPIELNKVKARQFQVISDTQIMPALVAIDNMGESAADNIEKAAKDGPFLSRDDFISRCKVSKTIAEHLAELGLLGDIPESNQISIFDFM